MHEAKRLREGGVGVLPTDTLYGLVASVAHPGAVARVYALKGRRPDKPCIILVSSVEEVAPLGVELSGAQQALLEGYWPGPVSVVLPATSAAPEHLHLGTHTLSFRLPADEHLRAFLRESGPLIAPSANPEGLPPATTLTEARAYFGDGVDFYSEGGVLAGEPSTLVRLDEGGTVTVLRQGRGDILSK